MLDERFGFAIGCCESVCYGDFTAAVSAGVTPAFDNGWPRLVSGGSQRAGQSGLRLHVSGFAAWGLPLPRNDVREAEPGWPRERAGGEGDRAGFVRAVVGVEWRVVCAEERLTPLIRPIGHLLPPRGEKDPTGASALGNAGCGWM